VSLSVSTVISPTKPVNVECSAVVPLRNCNANAGICYAPIIIKTSGIGSVTTIPHDVAVPLFVKNLPALPVKLGTYPAAVTALAAADVAEVAALDADVAAEVADVKALDAEVEAEAALVAAAVAFASVDVMAAAALVAEVAAAV
jgi:hypothetical protein